MFGNVWAANRLWGMFGDGVTGQNVWEMFEGVDELKKPKNRARLTPHCTQLNNFGTLHRLVTSSGRDRRQFQAVRARNTGLLHVLLTAA